MRDQLTAIEQTPMRCNRSGATIHTELVTFLH